jgi:glycerol-3-phosphate acyltransferase PlsX
MGAKYMEKIYNVDRPKVGQLNNGTEYNKGNTLQIESYQLLSDSGLNFVGNVESKEVPFGVCDVLVCDGFTGNITLKLIEGMGKFMSNTIKGIFKASPVAMVGGALTLKQTKALKKRLDPAEYGGAPFLGLAKPVIKAHGSSDARAFKNAIRQAVGCVNKNVIGQITENIGE